ncbi:MAG: VWA domain-containing protein [Trueperaceae bacterium]|nr:VWA domain-containing protein [Trueperaceae bacterium]
MTSLLDAFAWPWALAGLLLLPLLPRGRGWPWRWAVVAALTVAIAQPQRPGTEERVAVLVDVSDSTGGVGVAAAADLVHGLGGDAVVYRFAGDVARADAAGDDATARALDPGRTDVARALAVAVADGARRVVLVSDGVDTSAAGVPTTAPVPVDVLALPRATNARLEALTAPDRVTPGRTVEVVALIHLDRAARVVLRPDVDGALLEPIERDLEAGQHAVPFRVVAPSAEAAGMTGTLRVGAVLDVDFEQPTGDDAQTTEVAVTTRGAVLVIGDPAVAALLRTQGLDVEEGTPERVAAPFDPAAVVVRAGAGAFTPGQLEVLARYVDQGGGLLMTGGPGAFGLGGWYRTPVEAVLPVRSDVRTEVTVPQVAMVMVLDVSQSMAAGQPSRLELAKRGAIDVVDLAYETDQLGLIAFSDASATRWVYELRPATEAGKRAMLAATLEVQPQGGTVLAPAYTQAIEAVAASDAAIKHVIVLSDGKLYDGQGAFAGAGAPDWEAVAAGARVGRITTSAIAIGADADRAALEALARGGGGRFVEALDVDTLPRLFTNEALTAARDLLREEPVAPEGRRHPLSPFEGVAPPLDAYVATTLASEAEVLFVGLDDEPILAVTRAGLGRSAALTTDLGAWAGAFGRWDQLPAVLGGVVRWLQARPAPYSATTEVRGSELEVVVDAVVAGAYVNDRPLVARFQGAEVELSQVAPGRYVGALPVRGSGGTLVVADGADVVARRTVATPDPELADADGAAALAALAERTGGTVLGAADDLAAYRPPGAATPRPLWGWAAGLAFALLLGELAWRRFAPDPDELMPTARRPLRR